MIDVPKDSKTLLSIGAYGDVCTQIGVFVGCYAGLELMLWKLYAKILGLGEGPTIDVLGGIQSFAHKMAAIERFLEHANDPNKKRYLELFSDAQVVNSFRIDLMHGLYFKYADGSLWLHSSLTDPTRAKSRVTNLTAKVIAEKANLARNTAKAIAAEFFGTTFKDGQDDLYVTLLRK
jgi:hypothetical protein